MIAVHLPALQGTSGSAVSRFGGVLCGFDESCSGLVSRVEPSSAWAKIVILFTGSLFLHSARLDMSAPNRPAAFVVPAGAGPIGTRQEGAISCLEIVVPPWAATKIFGQPITEGVVEWSDLSPGPATELLDRLCATTDWERRFVLADAAIEQAARLSRFTPRREVLHAWDRMNDAKGAISIRELADEIGWSERYFADRFRADIGLLPKAAARQIRFDHAHHCVVQSTTSLAELAAQCGYADQSHMTRDFSELAGAAPATIRKAGLPDLASATSEPGAFE